LAAVLRADAAVFVLVGVLVAFFGACSAGRCARLHGCGDDLLIASGAANADRACCEAEIGAVLVQSNALTKLVHALFAQTGIGTGDAGLRARVAFFEAADQRFIRVALDARVSGDHFLHVVHHVLLLSWRGRKPAHKKESTSRTFRARVAGAGPSRYGR
jgi:hypothetical protein